MAELEREAERLLVKRVSAAGGHCLKVTAASGAGVPDRVVILPDGRGFLVELKSPSGTLRPVQHAWHARSLRRGVRVHVLRGKAEVAAWCDRVLGAVSR